MKHSSPFAVRQYLWHQQLPRLDVQGARDLSQPIGCGSRLGGEDGEELRARHASKVGESRQRDFFLPCGRANVLRNERA